MVTFTEILYSITGPAWLQSKIGIIALLFAGALLVYFGSIVHGNIILPLADWIRNHTRNKVSKIERVSGASNLIANSLATIAFLLYVWFGTFIVAEYILGPIFQRLRNFLLIIVVILFLLVSYAINTISLRKKFMGQ